jgi:hypothetical protein
MSCAAAGSARVAAVNAASEAHCKEVFMEVPWWVNGIEVASSVLGN